MIHRDREQGRAGKARAMTKDFIEYDSSRIASGSGLPYKFESTNGSGAPASVIDAAQMSGALYTFDSTESSDGSGLLLPPASVIDTVSSRSSGIGAWLDAHETYTDMGSNRDQSPLPVDSPFIDCLPTRMLHTNLPRNQPYGQVAIEQRFRLCQCIRVRRYVPTHL